jgi:ferrous iron transport protein A
MRSVANLKIGESGIIRSFTDADLSLKLLEMGCLPGAKLTISFVAPLGDPLAVQIDGYCLAMRLNEACTILID